MQGVNLCVWCARNLHARTPATIINSIICYIVLLLLHPSMVIGRPEAQKQVCQKLIPETIIYWHYILIYISIIAILYIGTWVIFFGRRKLPSDFQLFRKAPLCILDNREYDECKFKLCFDSDKKKRSDESHKSMFFFFFIGFEISA